MHSVIRAAETTQQTRKLNPLDNLLPSHQQSIKQSIRTNLYRAACHGQIRGKYFYHYCTGFSFNQPVFIRGAPIIGQ